MDGVLETPLQGVYETCSKSVMRYMDCQGDVISGFQCHIPGEAQTSGNLARNMKIGGRAVLCLYAVKNRGFQIRMQETKPKKNHWQLRVDIKSEWDSAVCTVDRVQDIDQSIDFFFYEVHLFCTRYN